MVRLVWGELGQRHAGCQGGAVVSDAVACGRGVPEAAACQKWEELTPEAKAAYCQLGEGGSPPPPTPTPAQPRLQQGPRAGGRRARAREPSPTPGAAAGSRGGAGGS